MKKLICWLKGHKRGKTKYMGDKIWMIKCSRCGYTVKYESPMARLVGEEISLGFTGD